MATLASNLRQVSPVSFNPNEVTSVNNLDRIDNELSLAMTALADAMDVPADGLTLCQAASIFNALQRHLKSLGNTRECVRVCRQYPILPSVTIDVE